MSEQIAMTQVRRLVWCALLATHLCLGGSAWGVGPLYFRSGRFLSPIAPVSTAPQDDISETIGAGQRAVLAEFSSASMPARVEAEGAGAVLYMVTGRLGMQNCAVVNVELARRSQGQRTVVGTGSLATSLLARRDTVGPIVVPITLTGVLALQGDQIALSVEVENRCGEARSVTLRYDALGWLSALRIDGASEPPTTTTTTTPATTTTMVSTTVVVPSTTTTTLPYPFGCLFQPLEGYEAVFCRLDTLDEVLVEEGPSSFGGGARYGRVQRRLDQARGRVSLALSGKRRPRQLRRAIQELEIMGRLVRRGVRQGLIDSDLGEELTALVGAATAQIGYLPRR